MFRLIVTAPKLVEIIHFFVDLFCSISSQMSRHILCWVNKGLEKEENDLNFQYKVRINIMGFFNILITNLKYLTNIKTFQNDIKIPAQFKWPTPSYNFYLYTPELSSYLHQLSLSQWMKDRIKSILHTKFSKVDQELKYLHRKRFRFTCCRLKYRWFV